MSKLIKNGALTDDVWTLLAYPEREEATQKQAGKPVLFKLTGAEAAPAEVVSEFALPAGKVLVPLAVWRARKDDLAARLAAGELGVWLESFELVEDLVESTGDLNQFPVIAINFPRFADGRGYSTASLLRTRYGYRNELRAVGDVLRDQLFYLKRCGFDAYAIRADRSAEEALASLKDFSVPYQGAVDEPRPLWRRLDRGEA